MQYDVEKQNVEKAAAEAFFAKDKTAVVQRGCCGGSCAGCDPRAGKGQRMSLFQKTIAAIGKKLTS